MLVLVNVKSYNNKYLIIYILLGTYVNLIYDINLFMRLISIHIFPYSMFIYIYIYIYIYYNIYSRVNTFDIYIITIISTILFYYE